MSLNEKIKELWNLMVEKVGPECTAANALSLSRPLLATYALEHFMDRPFLLSATLGAAFVTDAVDGYVARRFRSSKWGAYIDIAADRALELIVLFSYASHDLIPTIIPLVFAYKSAKVDGSRIIVDFLKQDFTQPLRLGGNDNRLERSVYGATKMSYFMAVPHISPMANLILGTATTLFAVYRGMKSGLVLDRIRLDFEREYPSIPKNASPEEQIIHGCEKAFDFWEYMYQRLGIKYWNTDKK